jgi:AbrB family looped-hinge helix DNA binding protein
MLLREHRWALQSDSTRPADKPCTKVEEVGSGLARSGEMHTTGRACGILPQYKEADVTIGRTSADIRVGRKTQIVIPARFRKALGIKEGDILHASIDEHGRILLSPVPTDPIERFLRAGRGLFTGVDPVEYQRELGKERDE